MCLGMPGRVSEVKRQDGLRLAGVSFGRLGRKVCLNQVPGAAAGDYGMMHARSAVSVPREAGAQQTLSIPGHIAGFERGTPVASADIRLEEPRSRLLASRGSDT
jgi:hydrogenase expression/formation protein HypC